VLFVKGGLFDSLLVVCYKNTMRKCISTTLYKIFVTNKHIRNLRQLQYSLTNTAIQFSLKSIQMWKSYSKKTKGSRFYRTRYSYCQESCIKLQGVFKIAI